MLQCSHEWTIPGDNVALFVKNVRLLINGITVDGFEHRVASKDVYTEFFYRYHMVVGDMMGASSDGMTIADFDDNAFIVPFDLTSNSNANLSEELVPAVRTGNLTLDVEFNKPNAIPGLTVCAFAEFPCRMEIHKDRKIQLSYNAGSKK